MLERFRLFCPNHVLELLIVVVFVVPLSISAIVIFIQNISRTTEESAFRTDVGDELLGAIVSQNNIDEKNVILHKIASSGEWSVVVLISVLPESYGNTTFAIMHLVNGEYQTAYIGTSYNRNTLNKIGVPSEIISAIEKNTNNYAKIITNSAFNPSNKYTLIKKLPYTSDKMKISYRFNNDLRDSEGVGIPIIAIDATNATQRSLALTKIQDFGYDLGDYRIEFNDFINQFTGENR